MSFGEDNEERLMNKFNELTERFGKLEEDLVAYRIKVTELTSKLEKEKELTSYLTEKLKNMVDAMDTIFSVVKK